MHFRIRHINLNSPKQANRLHGMIRKGIENRYAERKNSKIPNPDCPDSTNISPSEKEKFGEKLQTEKEKFVEELQKQEFNYLNKGFKQT